MDCPFYEQLMYDGDTRLELLTTSVMTRDDRLVKRAIELFDFSRRNWGFVNERFPAYLPQHSPTFSMIWAMMLSDYASWHNDPAFVRGPCHRPALDAGTLRALSQRRRPAGRAAGLAVHGLGAAVENRRRARRREGDLGAEQSALRCGPAEIGRDRGWARRAAAGPASPRQGGADRGGGEGEILGRSAAD